jgi:hypothetical protein
MASPAAPSAVLPASTGNSALDAYTQAAQNLTLGGGLNYSTSPTYQTLQSMLGPGANGGLNASLMGQYNAAQPLIAQQTGQNVAQAMSTAEGRGLGGSSIAAQGVENAEFQGSMQDASLLSSLYGQQNQDISQLAGDLFTGSGQMTSDLLGIYDSAGTSAANMQMYSEGLQEALQAAQIAGNAQQNAGIFQGAGSAIGGIGSGLGMAAIASDVRLKHSVERVGDVGDGTVGLYKFEYVSGRGLPAGKYVGFLAHEVRKTNPEAVVKGKDGYLYVKAPFHPRRIS